MSLLLLMHGYTNTDTTASRQNRPEDFFGGGRHDGASIPLCCRLPRPDNRHDAEAIETACDRSAGFDTRRA